MTILLQTSNLKKIYRSSTNIETFALNGIDLTIEKGEFLAIAGPSGSGKSTLLNIIGALDSATSGSIHFEEKDITHIPSNKLSIFRLYNFGFVFQAYNLINTLTAVENVEYIMLLQGIDPRKRNKKAVKILEEVGLENYINRFPNEMSGGQQQRVAIARAIVSEPKLILADEPTANLDSKTASSLLDLMFQLNKNKGMTFIFSTHDKMIMDKAKRLIKLHDGKIENE